MCKKKNLYIVVRHPDQVDQTYINKWAHGATVNGGSVLNSITTNNSVIDQINIAIDSECKIFIHKCGLRCAGMKSIKPLIAHEVIPDSFEGNTVKFCLPAGSCSAKPIPRPDFRVRPGMDFYWAEI